LATGKVMTASEPKWGNCKLTAHQLAGYTKASNALLADAAVGLEAFLRRAFGEAWAYYEDIAFISGSGKGEPLGVLNASCTIPVTRQPITSRFQEAGSLATQS